MDASTTSSSLSEESSDGEQAGSKRVVEVPLDKVLHDSAMRLRGGDNRRVVLRLAHGRSQRSESSFEESDDDNLFSDIFSTRSAYSEAAPVGESSEAQGDGSGGQESSGEEAADIRCGLLLQQ
jgi:hypothetical protein